jgi:photosystem II stability/assembly factor-like uncharacterized protein
MKFRRFIKLAGAVALSAVCSGYCAAANVADGSAAAGPAPVRGALERAAPVSVAPERALMLGAAQSGQRLVAVGERGIALWSDDAGVHWRQAAVPVAVTLTAVRLVDARRGYAVGHSGVVLRTVDGGQTWIKCLDGRMAAGIALAAAEAGGDARALAEAQRLKADGADKPLFDLHFYDADHGIVVGAYNLAFSTADGGRTWQSLMAGTANPKAMHLYALRAHGDTLLVAGEQGLALRSDDRGRSFRKLATPYNGSFFTAEFLDAEGRDMMLAGLRGNVWRSRDGGGSWTQWATPLPVSITGSALMAGSATGSATPALVLVNQAGQILRSDGGTFKLRPGAPLGPLAGVLPLKDGGMLALSFAGPVRIAANGGAK